MIRLDNLDGPTMLHLRAWIARECYSEEAEAVEARVVSYLCNLDGEEYADALARGWRRVVDDALAPIGGAK